MNNLILLRGGGDLATGVALRLYRAGFHIIITELAQPLAVRRAVSFSEAIYEGQWEVEGITARHVATLTEALSLTPSGLVPVLIAPELDSVFTDAIQPATFDAIIDSRLTKQVSASPSFFARPELSRRVPLSSPLLIGLGPGFTAGENCHAVIETNRGHNLGRVYWTGSAQPDTATPEGDPRRVLRAPVDGVIACQVAIGDHVEAGQAIATIQTVDDGRWTVASPFAGVVRGLIRTGLSVCKGLKIGDIDARNIRDYCFTVSDKALAVGGGVLEALLSKRKEQNLA